MRERDPFRELLESLNDDEWVTVEEDEVPDRGDGGNGGRGGRRGGGGGGGDLPQGNWRILLYLLIPFLLLTLFNRGLAFYTDYTWYRSLDFGSVFTTRITASLGLFFAGAIIFWLFLAINVLLARRLEPRGLDNTPISQVADAIGVRITPIVLLVGAVFAFFMGTGLATTWEQVLLYLNSTAFELTDPVFDNDVGFYIFTLPVWQILRNWLMTTVILTLIATAVVSGVGWRGWDASAAVRAHLSGLGAIILLLIAWQYLLDALQLVYSTRGAVFGAGYTDIVAQLPAYNILIVITLIVAVLLMVNVYLRRTWRAIVAVLVVWFGASVLAGNIIPGLVQQFQVEPNEYRLEQQYIEDNIALTRQAYGLDAVRTVAYQASENVTADSLLSEPETVRNIRLWDYRPLQETYNQIQALRQYYRFNDIDVDRYTIDGQLRQVMLAARELVPDNLAEEAQTWVNRRLVYTHGYGIAVSPVAEVTQDGLPTFLLKDLPPTGSLDVDTPQIYFGELTNNYVIVRTEQDEFDYPMGAGNVYTNFGADTGIPIGNYLNRLLFALRFGDFNILLTGSITSESRLLWQRNIAQRAQTVAPFLRFDRDPYIVLADGKLYWIHDAYTVSDRYPYSTPLSQDNPLLPNWRINYLRNTVKVVTDAYTGEMTYYVVDEDEPLVNAYSQIFPSLFQPMTEMSDALREHVRYPNDLFSIQSEVFRTYHMTDPVDFYNREDLWQWPTELFQNQQVLMEPYYVVMELPDEEELDFIQILPFTPATRENMISWLAARSDPEQYGEKIVYEFGPDTLFFGPQQIEARINQDPVISSQLSLWDQQGSEVTRGNLLVIPVGNGLLYVEPLYLQAVNGQIPELTRVILATSNQVVMAENLGLALAEIFGPDILEEDLIAGLLTDETLPAVSAPGARPPDTGQAEGDGVQTATLNQLIVEANDRYERAQQALQDGDWSTYGTELNQLQQLLQRMADLSGVPVEPTPPPEPEAEPEAESG